MKMTISPWLVRKREAKKLATARTEQRRRPSFFRGTILPSDPILKIYEGIPSWAVKTGLVKVHTF